SLDGVPDPASDIDYYEGLNETLLRAVPASAFRILEVGCAHGRLGAHLKQLDERRTVFGIERVPEAAAIARRTLDDVFEIDVEAELPPLEPGTLDCIL